MDRDVPDLIEKRKLRVSLIAEDLADRGIESGELVPGVQCCHVRSCPDSSMSMWWFSTGSLRCREADTRTRAESYCGTC
jgi:hypothetical protein